MRQQSALIKALATGKAVFGVQIIVEMNYNGYSFPHWAAEDQLEKLAGTLRKTLKRMRRYSQAKIYRWSELSDDEKRLLKERELPTLQEAPHGGTHTYLALNRTQDATALINGEEHLKLEVFEEVNKPLNMGDLFTEMIMLQAQLIDEISDTPACDDELLYLMSDPQKSGEGMSVAAWACLPAVVQTLGSQRVYQRIENAGLLVRPAFGARRESASDVFRIDIKPSGVTPLGDSLSALCATLKKLSADEMKQRKKLLTQKRLGAEWKTRLAQMLDTLQTGAPISENDLPGVLSTVRLAAILGETNCSKSRRQKLLIRMQTETQSGYMNICTDKDIGSTELDRRRGEMMKEIVTALFYE